MTAPTRQRVQLDMPRVIRKRAKAVAADRDMALVELVLRALAKVGDKELTKLIEKELAQKQPPGRPQK